MFGYRITPPEEIKEAFDRAALEGKTHLLTLEESIGTEFSTTYGLQRAVRGESEILPLLKSANSTQGIASHLAKIFDLSRSFESQNNLTRDQQLNLSVSPATKRALADYEAECNKAAHRAEIKSRGWVEQLVRSVLN